MNLETLWASIVDKLTGIGGRLIGAALVLVAGGLIIRYCMKLFQRSKRLEKVDPGVRSFLNSLVRVILYSLLILTAAGILGIPLTSFVAILTSASVAIGLALQGALANFVGGIMILLVHPFRVGDFIETASESGTVKSITVFYTILSTPDNKQITIPNGALTNAAIVNYSSTPTRRVDLTFSVAYDSDMDKVKALLLATVAEHEKVLADPAPAARLMKQNTSSLDFVLRAWCQSEHYWDVYFDLNEEVKRRFDAEGIEIPYSQVDVHMK